jgi:hypothetical protein
VLPGFWPLASSNSKYCELLNAPNLRLSLREFELLLFFYEFIV